MPAQISLRLENDDKVRLGLNKWAQSLTPISREQLRLAMQRAKKTAVPYNGGNSYNVVERGYVRTGDLGRSTYLVEEGLSVRIVSEAYRKGRSYSEYVVGRADGTGQAAVHAGYWVTLRDAVEAELETLTDDLDHAIQDSAEAIGL